MVDERGAPASGTVSLIDLATGATRHVEVGIHPTAIAVAGGRAYVANAMSDSVSEIDIAAGQGRRGRSRCAGATLRVLGGMPNALALRGETLYVADGGDNAAGRGRPGRGPGPRLPARRLLPDRASPSTRDGKTAFVLNTKGNGSVRQTVARQARQRPRLPGDRHRRRPRRRTSPRETDDRRPEQPLGRPTPAGPP